jgi:hypothetical protein
MNNLALVTQENDVEIKLRSTAQELCEAASEVLILTRHDLSHATDLVKAIKTRFKDIEDERTRMVKPFNDGVKAINARFKSMTAPLAEAEEAVKARMLIFQKQEEARAIEEAKRQERIAQEAAAKARAAQEAAMAQDAAQADETLDRAPMPHSPAMPLQAASEIAVSHRPTTYGQTGAVSTVKKTWAYELVDIQALAAARPDLVLVDAVKVNQEIRGKGGEIPGLRVFEKDVMQVR